MNSLSQKFIELVESGAILDLVIGWGTKVIVAIAVFVIGKWVVRRMANVASRVMEKSGIDPMLVGFLHNILYFALLTAVIIAAVDIAGIPTTSFIAVMGAAGLAIGLALQGSLSNFASGVMLIIFRPFKTGDFIEAGGTTGVAETIRIFNTVMRTSDNREIIVPNSQIFNGTITNFSARPTRRVDLSIGIGYDDDIDKAKEIIMRAMKSDSRVLDDPAPSILLVELGDSSVNFAVRPWVKSADYWDVFSDLNQAMKTNLESNGLSIPYPQRDVHLHQQGN